MKIIPVDHGLDLQASDLVRSPGLHVSDIYTGLYQCLEPKRYRKDSQPNPVLMAMGTAWEKHLEYLLLKNGINASRPAEFRSEEGIYFSPDLIIFNGETRIGEIKLTSMSARDMPTEPTTCFPGKMSKYLTQIMSYALKLGVEHARLYVLFLHQPHDPQFRCYDIEFTDQELRDNWSMMMNFARSKGML